VSLNLPDLRLAVLAAAVMMLVSVPTRAQEGTGSLHGVARDSEGGALPGVTVELSGLGELRVQTSDVQGGFRFLKLDPGDYFLRVELDGFAVMEYPRINIRIAQSTSVEVTMTPAVEEVISVTSESPLLDLRKLTQGTHVTQTELETIPTSRDPWALLTQTPGVNYDRIDVGGSRNQQGVFTAPGVEGGENDWQFDGVNVGLPGSTGPVTYFDFDQLEQVQIATGGNDITKKGAGVSLNMVTKRGTNEFRGSARFLVTDNDMFLFFKESSPNVDPDDLPPGQEEIIVDSLDRIEDVGFEAGGPVLRDRLWLWGSFGQNRVAQVRTGGQELNSEVETVGIKINGQLSSANSLVTWWNHTNKIVPNRGAGPTRAPETLWFQRGPSATFKVEDTHVFGSNFFLSGMYSQSDLGWALNSHACEAAGSCEAAPETLWDSDGVWQNSFQSGFVRNPSQQWRIDGSYFFTGGDSSHELKFGGSYRDFEDVSPFHWPGRDLIHVAGEIFGVPPGPVDFLIAQRGEGPPMRREFTSAWVQDTISVGNWTLNAGLRYDHQVGENEAFTVPANPAFPEFMPAVEFEGNDGGFQWEDIVPRVGITYALGGERKTLVRGSYARFASELSWSDINRVNPVSFNYAYFLFIDGNDNNMWDNAEIDGEPQFLFGWNFDPNDPLALDTPNQNDPNLTAPLTDEVVLGVEHSFLPEFVMGLNVTWRNTFDKFDDRDRVRDLTTGEVREALRGDYLFDHTVTVIHPDGQSYDVDFYRLREDYEWTGGRLRVTGDREVEYLGASLTLTKRLAHQWMLRGYVDYGRPEWHIPDSFFIYDNPMNNHPFWLGGFDDDGDLFGQGGGRGGGALLHSHWSFNVNGMYQIAPNRPWGFNLAGNVFGREGYPIPYGAASVDSTGEPWRAQATDLTDDFRYDDAMTVDVRFEKEFAASGNVGFVVSADLFNALNSGVVLSRDNGLNGPRPNYVDETLSPRIWRLGVRINWR